MKKIFALLAVVLAVVSCQKEINGLPVDSNNEAAVSLSVALPDDATRAAGADSAKGGVTNVDMTQYDIRFILEVYDANGNLAKERMIKSGDATSATFNFRLIPGRDYKFVVWADFVNNGSDADLHYETTNGLRLVAIKDWTAIDETRDAYTEAVVIDNYSGSTQIPNIVLTRPFAKLRVVTNDIKEMISVRPAIVKVNYFDTQFYTAFDAFAAQPIDQSYDGHELVVNLEDDTYTYETQNNTGEQTLFADYMFAKEGDRVKFTMDVEDNGGIELPQVVFSTDIPVNRNHLTTVYGPILTDANNITVTIDENFAGNINVNVWDGQTVTAPAYNDATKTYTVTNGAELAWIAAQNDSFKGKTVVLANGIDLGNEAWSPIGSKKDFEGTFDGKNYTIANLRVNVADNAPAGLFASIFGSAVVKNVKVANATIKGHYYLGVIAGKNVCADIEKCHVVDAVVEATTLNNDYGHHVGGITGFLSADGSIARVYDCSVKNTSVTAFRDVAAVVGTANAGNKPTVEKCNVENVTVTSDQLAAYNGEKDGNAGIFVGRVASTNTVIKDCTEGDGVVVIRKVDSTKELEYAVADAQNGGTIYIGGEVALPKFTDKSLTFEGVNSNAAIVEPVTSHIDKAFENSSLYFKKLKIKGTVYSSTSNGYMCADVESYTDCTFVDGYFMFAGEKTTVNKCVFNGVEGQYYWTGHAKNIEFTECTFNGVDRAVKVCSKIPGTYVATFDTCTFSATVQNKAALEIDGELSNGADILNTVNINNCVASGFKAGENTGEPLFNIKNGPENVTIKIDGNTWVSKGVIKDENDNYVVNSLTTLETALETAGAAGAGNTTIVFAENAQLDMTNVEWTPIKVDGYNGADIVTIEGNGAVITGLEAPLFAGGFAGGSGIVIKDLTIKDSNIVSANTLGSGAFIESVDSMAKIELTNCHLLNSTVTGGAGSRTGGLIGWTAGYSNVNDGPVKTYVTIDGCSVIGCTITCDGSVGGINGHAGNNDWTFTTITDCTIQNNKLISTDDGEWRVGVVVGTANVGEVTISNINESGNTLSQTGKTAPEGVKRNYYGRFVPGTTGKLTIDGVEI